MGKDFEVLAGGWLADFQFLRNQHAAHAVLDKIAVDLRGEVTPRFFQPIQDLEPALTCQRPKRKIRIRIHH